MAVYPANYKSFKEHRNLLDDVDAIDINQIQDEVEALQRTLGLSPTRFENTEASTTNFYSQITIPGGDSGGTEDAVIGSLTGFGQADRAIRAEVRNYASVSDRLDAIERGKVNHCFSLTASTIDIATSTANIDFRPTGIRFPLPSARNDPYSMHNGLGVTLKRSGFWVTHGLVVYTLLGAVATTNQGYFNLAIDIDSNWIPGMQRTEHFSTGGSVFVETTRAEFMSKGQRVSLRTTQNTGRTQRIHTARFSGFMVRQDD